MTLARAQIRPGRCYATDAGELRIVEGIDADFVVYANLFTAAGWTSRGPRERMAASRFAQEAVKELPCPDESHRWRAFG